MYRFIPYAVYQSVVISEKRNNAGRYWNTAKLVQRGNVAWFTGSDLRTSSNFALSTRNANGFNGIKWQEMHNIPLFYNKTIVDLCIGRQ